MITEYIHNLFSPEPHLGLYGDPIPLGYIPFDPTHLIDGAIIVNNRGEMLVYNSYSDYYTLVTNKSEDYLKYPRAIWTCIK